MEMTLVLCCLECRLCPLSAVEIRLLNVSRNVLYEQSKRLIWFFNSCYKDVGFVLFLRGIPRTNFTYMKMTEQIIGYAWQITCKNREAGGLHPVKLLLPIYLRTTYFLGSLALWFDHLTVFCESKWRSFTISPYMGHCYKLMILLSWQIQQMSVTLW